MKKYILAGAIALFSVAVLTTSCNKYEEGPSFSLLTKKQRLTGEWTLEAYISDGQDITSSVQAAWGPAAWIIQKDERYSITGSFNEHGDWELTGDKDEMRFDPDGNDPAVSYHILRLRNKELWLRYTNSNGTYDIIKFKQ
jgi:hypothetical protein